MNRDTNRKVASMTTKQVKDKAKDKAKEKLAKELKKNKYKLSLAEALVALEVGKKIIDEIGLAPELTGDYKKIYNRYIKWCRKQSLEGTEKFCQEDLDELEEELEDEALHIELFMCWLQNEAKIKLVK